MDYNTQYFDSADRKKGKDIEFIKCLLGIKQEDYYNDIHIYDEEGATIVEWAQVPYDHIFGGKFEFVDEDEEVMKEILFPDNTSMYVPRKDEEKAFEDWIAENPEWKKDEYGVWTNIKEEDE